MSGPQARRRPRAPSHLGDGGRALWGDVLRVYDLAAHERRILEQVCATVDAIAELDALVARDGALATGSKGQPVVHPAVAEARQQRSTFARLLAELRLPDEDGVAVPSPASLQAQRAARVRWDGSVAHGA